MRDRTRDSGVAGEIATASTGRRAADPGVVAAGGAGAANGRGSAEIAAGVGAPGEEASIGAGVAVAGGPGVFRAERSTSIGSNPLLVEQPIQKNPSSRENTAVFRMFKRPPFGASF